MIAYPLALGLDPGLAHCGLALAEIRGDDFAVVDLDVIATEKHDGKVDVYAADDNLRRARELAAALRRLLDGHGIAIVCAEAMSHPMFVNRATGQRNVLASVVGQLSLAWGVVAAHAERFDLPIVQASPQALKKAVCGNRAASKDEMQVALDRLFNADLAALYLKPKRVPKASYEHAYDALASIVATRESEVFRLVRRGSLLTGGSDARPTGANGDDGARVGVPLAAAPHGAPERADREG